MEKTRFDDMAYGALGKAVKDAMPHTEADPIGVLATVLAFYSAALNGIITQPNGRPIVVWTALVGPSNLGRKGYALATGEAILAGDLGNLLTERRHEGVSSGPTLVAAMHEQLESTRTSEGGPDGRVILFDDEWSKTLQLANRCPKFHGIWRTSWDGKRVSNTTKGKDGKPVVQTVGRPQLGGHFHIQPELWGKYVSLVAAQGGTYNRILPVLTIRSKLLPTTNEDPLSNVKPSRALAAAYEWARKGKHKLAFSETARRLYDGLRESYEDELAEMPRNVACFVERAAEQVLRVASVLTVANRKSVISEKALEAARHFVDYSIDSVKQLVADSAANTVVPKRPLIDRIITALTGAGGSMTRTQLLQALGGRFSAAQIDAAVSEAPQVELERLPSTRPGPKPTVIKLVAVQPEGLAGASSHVSPEPGQGAPEAAAPRLARVKAAPAPIQEPEAVQTSGVSLQAAPRRPAESAKKRAPVGVPVPAYAGLFSH
ncbi:DUF3987 domain-containing protein [Streptomyces sp. NPDC053048]|uniref:DUF3987 domain-containing protein n=1 Tax=Streptomyces sp. NPDC053048 TaxID=3365694 RepID=UPI0037D1667C